MTIDLTPCHELLDLARQASTLEQAAKLWLNAPQLETKDLKACARQCQEALEAVLAVIPELRQRSLHLNYQAWSAKQQELIEVFKSYKLSPDLTTAFQEALHENRQDIQHFMQPETVLAMSEILELQVKTFIPLLHKVQGSNFQGFKKYLPDVLKSGKNETFLGLEFDSLAGIELITCALLFIVGVERSDARIPANLKSEQAWLDPSR